MKLKKLSKPLVLVKFPRKKSNEPLDEMYFVFSFVLPYTRHCELPSNWPLWAIRRNFPSKNTYKKASSLNTSKRRETNRKSALQFFYAAATHLSRFVNNSRLLFSRLLLSISLSFFICVQSVFIFIELSGISFLLLCFVALLHGRLALSSNFWLQRAECRSVWNEKFKEPPKM